MRKISKLASAFLILFRIAYSFSFHLLGWLTIRVVHGGDELELWGHQGVVLGKGHLGLEESALTIKFGQIG